MQKTIRRDSQQQTRQARAEFSHFLRDSILFSAWQQSCRDRGRLSFYLSGVHHAKSNNQSGGVFGEHLPCCTFVAWWAKGLSHLRLAWLTSSQSTCPLVQLFGWMNQSQNFGRMNQSQNFEHSGTRSKSIKKNGMIVLPKWVFKHYNPKT